MKTKTHQTTIYIAGDLPTIKATCRADPAKQKQSDAWVAVASLAWSICR